MRHQFPVIPAQSCLATREQLRDVGWSQSAIRHLLRTVGQEPFPGVVLPHRGRLDERDRVMALALWAGPAAVLTGAAALAHRGVRLPRPPSTRRYLVLGPARCRKVPGVQIVRTKRMPLYAAGIVQVAGVARSLVDAGRYREYSREDLRALTISVLQNRHSTPAAVSAELAGGRRNGTAAVRRGLRDYQTGAWSAAEVWLRRVVRRHSLPSMLANPTLFTHRGERIGTPDGYFADAGVAVQVHSRAHHSGLDENGNDRWESTVEADSAFSARGILVVGVAPTTLRDAPKRFVDRLIAAIRSQRGRTPPDVVVRPFQPCPVSAA